MQQKWDATKTTSPSGTFHVEKAKPLWERFFSLLQSSGGGSGSAINPHLVEVARLHRGLIIAFPASLVLLVFIVLLYYLQTELVGGTSGLTVLLVFWWVLCSLAFVPITVMMSLALGRSKPGVMGLGVLVVLPGAHLIVLQMQDNAASQRLHDYGFHVGLFGCSPALVQDQMRRGLGKHEH